MIQFKQGDKVALDGKGGDRFVVLDVSWYRESVFATPVRTVKVDDSFDCWRPASRFTLVTPVYTIDSTDPTFLRARDSAGSVIASLVREKPGQGARETARTGVLHDIATSLGYALQDPE